MAKYDEKNARELEARKLLDRSIVSHVPRVATAGPDRILTLQETNLGRYSRIK